MQNFTFIRYKRPTVGEETRKKPNQVLETCARVLKLWNKSLWIEFQIAMIAFI